VADPAPLGLAAFALTTFLLSAANAGWMTKATGDAWLGYAFAYGGLAQLLAGMWEFRNRNVFGATAFSTYGGFWIGLGLWALLVAPKAVIGNFDGSTGLVKTGGYIGLVTALVAWYTSAAGVMNGHLGRPLVPVGSPFVK
jgi:succinate-acetate transporter protein